PLALRRTDDWMPWLSHFYAWVESWALLGTLGMLLAGLIIAHLWLPAGRRKIADVLPGICLTLLAWGVGAYAFASYLTTFANYVSTYAGLASIMIALVFL